MLTPLRLAVMFGHSEVADYPIEKGARLDDQGNAVAMACKYCGATDVPTMQKCSGCRVVWYCGPECQKKDWREGGENKHKLQCPRIKEQRDLYKEKKKEEAQEIDERTRREVHTKAFGEILRVSPELKDELQQMTLEEGLESIKDLEESMRDHPGFQELLRENPEEVKRMIEVFGEAFQQMLRDEASSSRQG